MTIDSQAGQARVVLGDENGILIAIVYISVGNRRVSEELDSLVIVSTEAKLELDFLLEPLPWTSFSGIPLFLLVWSFFCVLCVPSIRCLFVQIVR